MDYGRIGFGSGGRGPVAEYKKNGLMAIQGQVHRGAFRGDLVVDRRVDVAGKWIPAFRRTTRDPAGDDSAEFMIGLVADKIDVEARCGPMGVGKPFVFWRDKIGLEI